MSFSDTLAELFGWRSAVNIGLLILESIAVVLVCGPISKIHAKLP